MTLFIGIDVGTSGCRAVAIDEYREVIAQAHQPLSTPVQEGDRCWQEASAWWDCLTETLTQLCQYVDPVTIKAISLDATSSTLLVSDEDGRPLGPALMYKDCSCKQQAERIETIAPPNSIARGASSSLSKLLYLYELHPDAQAALHQTDWLLGQLSGQYGSTDENNALKLGYDPIARQWPNWLEKTGLPSRLFPRVLEPGKAFATLKPELAKHWGMPPDTRIVTGTTDSTAAFLATGAVDTGDAVTSLGSSLVLKVLSDRPVFAPEYGVYSHRLGDRWLAGGASNTGGAVLLKYFTRDEMEAMSTRLDTNRPSGLEMYPLTGPGERFPYNDPDMLPRIPEFPHNDAEGRLRFFHGMLESIARIEKEGYALLEKLGAPYPLSMRSVGGGSRNAAWTRIRQGMLGVPMVAVEHPEAAYGTALLALKACSTPG